MLLVREIIGNIHDDDGLANAYEEYDARDRVEQIVLDETDRKRSRLRTTTDRGTDVGLVVDDPTGLSAGDVVARDNDRMIVVATEQQEAAIVDLEDVEDTAAGIAFGHHVGNQHQDLTVKNGQLYLPVEEKRSHVRRTIEKTLGDVPIEYEQVDPGIFGVSDRSPHSHGDDHDHSHGHSDTSHEALHSYDSTDDTDETMVLSDTPSAALTAFQLTDSFLPVGSYTASYGIESFAQKGIVDDADDIRTLLTDYLHRQVGPCDMVAVRAAHEAATAGNTERLVEIDQRFHAATLPAEFRASSTASGTQLLEMGLTDGAALADYRDWVADGRAHGHFPVVLGAIASRAGIGVREACLMQGYSFVSGLLAAAQRLLQLSHTTVQTVLDELKPVICEVWNDHRARDVEEICSFAPSIELMSMAHERADRRLFRS